MAEERVAAQLRELDDYRRRKLQDIISCLATAYENPTIDAWTAAVTPARELLAEYGDATSGMSRDEIKIRYALRNIVHSYNKSVVDCIDSRDFGEACDQIDGAMCSLYELLWP